MSIGGAITGGTPNSVLFVGPGGVLAQDNANLSWNDSTDTLGVTGTSNFSGALTGPTVAGTDNSTNVATTAFVKGLGYQTGNQTITLSGAVSGSGATAITTAYAGNLPVGNLNSGTGASSTTFWRGDGTWAVPAGGGGGGMSIGGAVTGGTPNSVLFIDGSSNLAQDNANFWWDDVNYRLHVSTSGQTGEYWLNGVVGLFEVPNASGNNWFEGNSGNRALTGYGNFGTGDGCLGSLTTGFANTGVGGVFSGYGIPIYNMGNLTTGARNMAVGAGALGVAVANNYNTAIGALALIGLNSGYGQGDSNVALGLQALQQMQQGNGNVAIGTNAGAGLTSISQQNVMIGSGANPGNLGSSNIMIGGNCGQNLSGTCDYNIWFGTGGPAVANLHDTFALMSGRSFAPYLDVNLTHNTTAGWFWTFGTSFSNKPVSLYLYNTQDTNLPPTNYERGILDWNATANVFRLASQAGGTGTVRLIAIDGFQKAGAPAAGDLPSGTFALINDTSGGQTWLAYNAAGTIRKVQLV
jgi:hypothetical protein